MPELLALTISQPFASLIADGEKFVENRTWDMFYRGPLAIHAGKGTQYLTAAELKEYPTSCIVAVCEVEACLHHSKIHECAVMGQSCRGLSSERLNQIAVHLHTEGPFCIVLKNVLKLPEPVPCKGAQGLWKPPPEVMAAINRQVNQGSK